MTKDERLAQENMEERLAKGDVFEVRIGNRKFIVGDILTITGVRGEFEFRAARVDDAGVVQWIQVVGGTPTKRAWRHFTPDRIKSKKRKTNNE